jgi:hypothetical protein
MPVGRAADAGWLLSFSRDLRRIDDYKSLVELVRAEVCTALAHG